MPRKRTEGTRAPNGAASIYLGKDGRWHGRVTMGVRDNGTPDRRHVSAKTEAEVVRKVRDLEKQRDQGRIVRPGKAWTVEKWLAHWLEHIAEPSVSENTISGYRVAVNVHLLPGLGAHRLDKLRPEHLERFYKKMQSNGKKPATAHQAHRTIRTALNEAKRRGYIMANPAELAKAPQIGEEDIEPYTLEEVRRMLREAEKRPNGTRWAIALALGLRQGEALGLKWQDVNLKRGVLSIRRSRLRPKYEHGCDGMCGRAKGGYCPQRKPIRKAASKTKSRAGKRTVGIPSQVVHLLEAHRAAQEQARAKARDMWKDDGWVFTDEFGSALNPRTDYDEWKRLLTGAGVRDGRLHDARHTAATVLLILGITERAVMAAMGWSSSSMTVRYQHFVDPIRKDIADRVDGLLWGADDDSEEGPE